MHFNNNECAYSIQIHLWGCTLDATKSSKKFGSIACHRNRIYDTDITCISLSLNYCNMMQHTILNTILLVRYEHETV